MSGWFELEKTPIEGLVSFVRSPRKDERGSFERLFCCDELTDFGIAFDIKQMNRSITKQQGAVRGLHFQRPPFAEGKLITCLSGHVFDVAVDLRNGSPTLGQWHGFDLSAQSNRTVYIPPGFAHGFQTCAPDCELLYLHSQRYQPDHEGGLHCLDPILSIDWPGAVTQLSERDAKLPAFDDTFEALEL